MTRTPAPTIDLWRRFTPFPTQRRFLQSTAKYRLLSSGYGGGKTALGCRESIRHAATHPGSTNLVARDTGTDLRDTTIKTFWREARTIGFQENTHYTYNRQDKEITWWNGSTTMFRHFEDVEALGSLELSTAFIDEGSEVHDDIYTALFPGRLRAHLPNCDLNTRIQTAVNNGHDHTTITCNCPQRAWVCTNPGASGYLKAVTLGQAGNDWEWFPVAPAENPFNGPDYYRELADKLRTRGEVWYRRLYLGDWTAFEGQRFTMFDPETHILPTDFTPTNDYEIIEGWDFGHRETFITWIAYRPDSNEPTIAFDELQYREVDAPGHVARLVHQRRKKWGIANRVRALGDPAGAAATQFSSVTPITAYAAHNIHIAPCRAGKDPLARADLIATLLNERRRQQTGETWPGLVISPRCTALIDSITNLRWDKKAQETGGRERFIKNNDHGFDSLGYGLIGTPPPGAPPTEPRARPGINTHPTPDDATRGDNENWITV